MRRNVRRAGRFVGGVDPWLTLALIALVFTGLLMVYSASIADSYTYYGSPVYYFEREVVWVALGLITLAVAIQIDYHRLERFALPIFAVSLGLLFLVLVAGHTSHGAQRWFSVGSSIEIEPSEIIKLALILYLATWLAHKGEGLREFKKSAFPFMMMVGIIGFMIEKQPDLGTTIVVVITAFSIYFLAGGLMRHIATIMGFGALAVYPLLHAQSYRSGRLSAFLDPWKEATGAGYHTVQVLLALGSGGILGRGLGNSIQKDVLPAPHTDSILAVIGEELGLIGTVSVLLLFLIIAYRGLRISATAPDDFGRLLAAGITCWITLQALMNFAVITSSVPFTGVPLPFISFGGTSLIISLAAMGILLNISRHKSGASLARQDSDHGRGNGRPRVPRVIDHPSPDGEPLILGSRRRSVRSPGNS